MPLVGELAGGARKAASGVLHPILAWALLCGVTGLLVVASRMKFGAAAAIVARFLLLMPIIGFVAIAMQIAVTSFRLLVDGILRGGHIDADISFVIALALIYIMRWRLRMLIVLTPALLGLLPFFEWSGPIFVSLCGESPSVWPDPVPAPAPPAPDVAMADNSPYAGCGAPAQMPTLTD